MTLIGLVRVTSNSREVELQYAALQATCSRVSEEPATQTRLIKNRPHLLAALYDLHTGDLLVLTSVRYLAQTSIDGLGVLVDLVDRGIAVRVLSGMGEGDHSEPSFFLTQCREIADLRQNLWTDRIKAGLKASQESGSPIGRPRIVTRTQRNEIITRRGREHQFAP
ncbi:recombinase family protein [Brevibacterium sediminis]|uniref:Resolvase/invertase-type recombinase catalytic domain-containing protein n=1 Tax=Brevibacterium sediminis TaxID=1857024 RepID=A0A5C4X6B1_9MICO|nr:hypothetical protein FHQ09_02480 [Brevibacterium sediminis]